MTVLGHGHESATPAGLQPGTGSPVAALVGWLSPGLAPQGIAEVDRILNQQDSLTEFDTGAGAFPDPARRFACHLYP